MWLSQILRVINRREHWKSRIANMSELRFSIFTIYGQIRDPRFSMLSTVDNSSDLSFPHLFKPNYRSFERYWWKKKFKIMTPSYPPCGGQKRWKNNLNWPWGNSKYQFFWKFFLQKFFFYYCLTEKSMWKFLSALWKNVTQGNVQDALQDVTKDQGPQVRFDIY